MTIGYTNGAKVIFNAKDHTVRVYGTYIMMVGSTTKEEAIAQAKRNLKKFKEASMKYEVRFEFETLGGTGKWYSEWHEDYLNDNGKGFTLEDAESVAYDVRTTEMFRTRNVRIVEMI